MSDILNTEVLGIKTKYLLGSLLLAGGAGLYYRSHPGSGMLSTTLAGSAIAGLLILNAKEKAAVAPLPVQNLGPVTQVALPSATAPAAPAGGGATVVPFSQTDTAAQNQIAAAQQAAIQSTAIPVVTVIQPTPVVAPVAVGPAQDNFTDPGSGLAVDNRPDPTVVSDPSLVNQVQNALGI